MKTCRIALANLSIPTTPEDSVAHAVLALGQAAEVRATIICFPECFIPGYRIPAPPVDTTFLEGAWARIAAAAAKVGIGVVLGTERRSELGRHLTALVINRDGTYAGFQDKVQLDPSEETTYSAGTGRRIFQCDDLTFGVVICHEGWRYPETVRWAARRGAQVVFHPHFDMDAPNGFKPGFADPSNTFHEKAMLCRAAENSIYFASVNCAGAGAATTSAVVRPDGTLLAHQPYGKEGLLIADLDLELANRLLATRCKIEEYAT
ncbi:MAG: carbon-nitrogen hydrolase family protein [Opitutaceae bacterium]|nr:carbon-nitrogen hydrolase family protein [Opitutaceae bacterium]